MAELDKQGIFRGSRKHFEKLLEARGVEVALRIMTELVAGVAAGSVDGDDGDA